MAQSNFLNTTFHSLLPVLIDSRQRLKKNQTQPSEKLENLNELITDSVNYLALNAPKPQPKTVSAGITPTKKRLPQDFFNKQAGQKDQAPIYLQPSRIKEIKELCNDLKNRLGQVLYHSQNLKKDLTVKNILESFLYQIPTGVFDTLVQKDARLPWEKLSVVYVDAKLADKAESHIKTSRLAVSNLSRFLDRLIKIQAKDFKRHLFP